MRRMKTDTDRAQTERPSLSWYREQLHRCVERERLNHSYKRDVLLETLYEQDEPVTVDALYFAMSRDRKGRISINTVYRNIKLLMACDLVLRVEIDGSPKYILNAFEMREVSVVCGRNGRSFLLEAPGQWQFQLMQMLREKGVNVGGKIVLTVECEP